VQNNFPEYVVGSRLIRFLMKIGSSSELDPEERRRRISAVFALLVIMISVSFFSIYHYCNRNYSVAGYDLLTFFISLFLLLYIRKQEKASIAYWIMGCGGILVFSGTTVFGRTDVSILLWAFLLPAMSFSIMGDKKGLVIALTFFCTSILLMTAPQHMFNSAPYSPTIVIRFSIIYLMLTFVIYYYESAQQMLIRYIQQERDNFENASKHDLLTGLSNRRDIMDKMENERERYSRIGKPFVIIMGDIDNFKNLNDTYGHDAGDYVLQTIGSILRNQVRGIDCPSRWGGEEFLIVLVDTDMESGQRVAERIRRKIENTNFNHKNKRLSVTMTFGLSAYQNAEDNIDESIKCADKALYEGKNRGKNTVVTAV
jgi:diguanylate cyclase (GGDEF)-like protein